MEEFQPKLIVKKNSSNTLTNRVPSTQEKPTKRAVSASKKEFFMNFLVKQREQLEESKRIRKPSFAGKIVPSTAIREDKYHKRHPTAGAVVKRTPPPENDTLNTTAESLRQPQVNPSKEKRIDWHHHREAQLKQVREYESSRERHSMRESNKTAEEKKNEEKKNQIEKERHRKMLDEILKEKTKNLKEEDKPRPPLKSKTPRTEIEKSSEVEAESGSLENYSVGKQIGQGAFAVVRSAVHRTTGEVVAIKTYDKLKLIDIQRKKSVYREINILEKLSHPNIVELIEVIDTPKQLHLVMENVSGTSLHIFLKRRPSRKLNENLARKIFHEICSALHYCHANNVTHRDIKLENMIIDDSYSLKLIDFGFSTCYPHEIKTKVFCGTPSYMAPEILSRKEYSGAPADVWALGVLLFVLLCGNFPFKATNDRELYRKIQRGRYNLPESLPANARRLVIRMLTYEARARPSIEDILSDPWLGSEENACMVFEKTSYKALSINGETTENAMSVRKSQTSNNSQASNEFRFLKNDRSEENIPFHYSAMFNYQEMVSEYKELCGEFLFGSVFGYVEKFQEESCMASFENCELIYQIPSFPVNWKESGEILILLM